MSPLEVRQGIREKVREHFFPGAALDPLDQTDDNVFALFDVGDDDG